LTVKATARMVARGTARRSAALQRILASASNSGPPEQFGSGGHLSLFTLPHNRVQWLADL